MRPQLHCGWPCISQAVLIDILGCTLQADYKVVMADYERDHPKPPRRQKRVRDPAELKRPQSAYFFFLADFRDEYKVSLQDLCCQIPVACTRGSSECQLACRCDLPTASCWSCLAFTMRVCLDTCQAICRSLHHSLLAPASQTVTTAIINTEVTVHVACYIKVSLSSSSPCQQLFGSSASCG